MVFENWLRVLTKPKQVFAEEKENASLGKALKIIFVAGVIAGILTIGITMLYIHFPQWWFFGMPSSENLYGNLSDLSEYSMLLFVLSLFVFLYVLISAVIGLLIGSGIYYILAKLLKGSGDFTTQTYLIALFSAPCMVIGTALYLIPFIGWFLGLLVVVYELYLLTLALKETHQYSTGKAILTWLIPFIIVFILIFAAIVAIILSSGFIMS